MAATIEPLGDQALVIVVGRGIDPDVNRRVCALASRIRSARPAGVVDVVPSFDAVTVHYRADAVPRADDALPYDAMVAALAPIVDASTAPADDADGPIVEIPVCYGGAHGPDLDEAASRCGVTADALVALHHAPLPLRVYMIGFAPGAPYIGLHDATLALPRRATPRVRVPAGTVAIANRQTVIYPFEAPGGWNLIGRTPLVLFDAWRDPPGLLTPGTRVRFVPIDEARLLAWPDARP